MSGFAEGIALRYTRMWLSKSETIYIMADPARFLVLLVGVALTTYLCMLNKRYFLVIGDDLRLVYFWNLSREKG
jgi:hypothetical protein